MRIFMILALLKNAMKKLGMREWAVTCSDNENEDGIKPFEGTTASSCPCIHIFLGVCLCVPPFAWVHLRAGVVRIGMCHRIFYVIVPMHFVQACACFYICICVCVCMRISVCLCMHMRMHIHMRMAQS